MKKIISLFIFLNITSLVYAQATDIRISDESGHVLNISSNGNITITTTNGTSTGGYSGAVDNRVSDNDGDVLNINSDRTVSITVTVTK